MRLRLLITVLLAVGSVFAAPLPAQSDTPGCVVRTEFRQVHDGMPMGRVHRIFDTSGHQSAVFVTNGQTHRVRNYRACHRPPAVVRSGPLRRRLGWGEVRHLGVIFDEARSVRRPWRWYCFFPSREWTGHTCRASPQAQAIPDLGTEVPCAGDMRPCG